MFFFFKQKTAYEMRISDWSSDVALPIFQLAVQRTELVRASASDDPLRYDDALADQAMVLSQAGRYAQDEPIARAALAGYRTLSPPASQQVLDASGTLALIPATQHNIQAALRRMRGEVESRGLPPGP